jgi:predicted ATPase/DNA-binding CsgD family transcriptional regulator
MRTVHRASSLASLPLPRTRLIGREGERATARALLLDDAVALLTLTGPGGVGKTQLALAVASEAGKAFADGVAFVDLAPVSDPEVLPAAIAAALNVTAGGDGDLTAALITHLRPAQVLLLLDNCEHLIDPVGQLVSTLLAGCPALQVLATSRAPLHVREEHLLPVPPLEVPPENVPLRVMRTVPAAVLFEQRARAVDPQFALTEQNAEAITHLCRRLDGLPLAIELAAARANLLSPAALLALLSHRLQVLGTGPRDAPTRHHTLHDAIAWSYDLLEPEQQQAFRQLAVFTGGWTLEAAAAITATSLPHTLVHIESLVNQNLIVRQTGIQEDQSRYRMLETIHVFASERLAATEEMESVEERRARFFLDLAGRAETEIDGHRQIFWLDRLEQDHPNIRAVLAWALRNGRTELAMNLAWRLCYFWRLHSHEREGVNWLEQSLAAGESVSSELRARVMLAVGLLATDLGRPDLALLRATEGLAIAVELRDPRLMGEGHFQIGRTFLATDDTENADPHLREALLIFQSSGNQFFSCVTLSNLATLADLRGNLVEAQLLYTEALELARVIGNNEELALDLLYLSDIAIQLGEADRALALGEEALALLRRIGGRARVAWALTEVGCLRADHLGDDVRASAAFNEALAMLRDSAQLSRVSADSTALIRALHGMGDVTLRQGNIATAMQFYEEEQAIARKAGIRVSLARAIIGLAAAAWCLGESAQAVALAKAGLAQLPTSDNLSELRPKWHGHWALQATSAAIRILAHSCALRDPDRSVYLFAAATSALEASGSPVFRKVRQRHDEEHETLRAIIGDSRFELAWTSGTALTVQGALDAAQAVHPPSVITPTLLVPFTSRSTAVGFGSDIGTFPLTHREQEILVLLCQRWTDTEIAEHFFISPRTVNRHVSNILAKLGASNRREAAAIAARGGLA